MQLTDLQIGHIYRMNNGTIYMVKGKNDRYITASELFRENDTEILDVTIKNPNYWANASEITLDQAILEFEGDSLLLRERFTTSDFSIPLIF